MERTLLVMAPHGDRSPPVTLTAGRKVGDKADLQVHFPRRKPRHVAGAVGHFSLSLFFGFLASPATVM